ncbi:MAG: hypothetical protein GWP10_13190 [Nitrospiraceae bacterium]|nr:hypothetical protein [Nitrospiraceae bacterium]
MVKVFDRLKILANKRNVAPESFKGGFKLFLDTGKLGEPTVMRKKLKLPEPPKSGADELKGLIAIINERNRGNQDE